MEIRVVAVGMVVAEVRAAALGAGQRGDAEWRGPRGSWPALRRGGGWRLPLRGDFGQSCVAGGLRGQALAQRRLLAQQSGIGPHGGLQCGDELFDAALLRRRSRRIGAGRVPARRRAERQAVGEHGLRGARAEDEAFEQRVRGQAVGAVDAGAGGFAGGVEPGEGGAAVEIGADAAHEVVRRGADGDQVAARGRGRTARGRR